MYRDYPKKRYKKTLAFLKMHVKSPASILDLGVKNPFSFVMTGQGYHIQNTEGEDLDFYPEAVLREYDAVTAFEIFEHLLSPFTVLRDIKSKKLVATVPLRLWFAPAYRNKNDERDRHFHEFESWQFDWLLQKAGWKIKARQKWTHPVKKIGFRPLLRLFVPRYYAVYAEREE